MRLVDLARQVNVEVEDLLAAAQRLGLAVDSRASVLSSADEFALRRDLVLQEQPALAQSTSPPLSPGSLNPFGLPRRQTIQRGQSHGPARHPSDLAKVFLERDAQWAEPYSRPLPRHVLVARAEEAAREWALHMFDAREARAWVQANSHISAQVAAALRRVGLAPEQAAMHIRTARGFIHNLPLAIRVSSGELTATEAAAEFHAWAERTSHAS
jgi:hypothetical protein